MERSLLELMKSRRSIRKYKKDYRPVAILPIGYPAETPPLKTRPRKPLEQLVHQNRYALKKL